MKNQNPILYRKTVVVCIFISMFETPDLYYPRFVRLRLESHKGKEDLK